MLFSEPKIPQHCRLRIYNKTAERFQCSSASRKFLNIVGFAYTIKPLKGFSALQRAENSSTSLDGAPTYNVCPFQCSSASRKFLNRSRAGYGWRATARFSALQRAENSSTAGDQYPRAPSPCFSALQRAENSSTMERAAAVLAAGEFQCSSASRKFLNFPSTSPHFPSDYGFSALQRAENSSTLFRLTQCIDCGMSFSALQRAENSSTP